MGVSVSLKLFISSNKFATLQPPVGEGGGGEVRGFKALLQLANLTLGPDATRNTEIHNNLVRIKVPNSVNAPKQKHKNQLITIIIKDEYSWLILLYARVNENQQLKHGKFTIYAEGLRDRIATFFGKICHLLIL